MPKCINDPKSYYNVTAPSPTGRGYCAHAEREGTIKRGKDGKMWQVKRTKGGTLRWVRVNSASTKRTRVSKRKKSSAKSQTKRSSRVARLKKSSSKHYQIVIAEPRTFSSEELGPEKLSFASRPLVIDQKMYDVIVKVGPKIYRNKNGNAYQFGRFYPFYEYDSAGSHGNDVAQTGIIDVEKARRVDPDLWEDESVWEDVDTSWEVKSDWTKVRRRNPAILWFGTTDGGDVGANVFIHRNRQTSEIDSIIIDNDYFRKSS